MKLCKSMLIIFAKFSHTRTAISLFFECRNIGNEQIRCLQGRPRIAHPLPSLYPHHVIHDRSTCSTPLRLLYRHHSSCKITVSYLSPFLLAELTLLTTLRPLFPSSQLLPSFLYLLACVQVPTVRQTHTRPLKLPERRL